MESNEIIQLIKQRNEKGLNCLYDQYSAALNGIAFRILYSEKLAEEVIQEVFLKIWNKIDQYDENKSTLFTWMSRIARNSALDIKRLKKFQHVQNTDSLDLGKHNIGSSRLDDAGLDTSALTAKLDKKHKMVLDYIYLEGYTHKETAEALQIPLGTVKTRIRNAISELRTVLQDEKHLFVGSSLFITIIILFLCL